MGYGFGKLNKSALDRSRLKKVGGDNGETANETPSKTSKAKYIETVRLSVKKT